MGPFCDALDGIFEILEDEEPYVECLGTLSFTETTTEVVIELSNTASNELGILAMSAAQLKVALGT